MNDEYEVLSDDDIMEMPEKWPLMSKLKCCALERKLVDN